MYIYERPKSISYQIGDITIGYDEDGKNEAYMRWGDNKIVIPIEHINTIRNILADIKTINEKDNE